MADGDFDDRIEPDATDTPGLDTTHDDEPPAEPDEAVDAEVVDESGSTVLATREDVVAAIEDALGSQEIAPLTRDKHEGLVAMDARDAAAFVGGLVRQAQEANLGKRWVYKLPGTGGSGLTVDAVQDITQQMNWTGRCRISLLPETLQVEIIQADEGRGTEPFWVATVFAVDEMTGQKHVGTSMEPQSMHLKPGTAKAKREAGAKIPEDNRIFDKFARAKAINKAERNAEEKHIPEVVKLTLIAMAEKNPGLVETIRTPVEEKIAALPAPLDTPEAAELREECEAIYLELGALDGGKGRLVIPPGRYNGAMMNSQHDMVMLRSTKAWLEDSRDRLRAKVEAS